MDKKLNNLTLKADIRSFFSHYTHFLQKIYDLFENSNQFVQDKKAKKK